MLKFILIFQLVIGTAVFTDKTSLAFQGREEATGEQIQVNAPGSFDWDAIQVLDLETAERIALVDNLSLGAAEDRVLQARARVMQARSTYWPRLDAVSSSSRVRLSVNEHRNSLQSARMINPRASINDPEDFYNAELTASWILFDGFKRKFSNAIARYGEQESHEALMEARRLLLSSVAAGYYSAQLARENIAIAEADETFNRRQMVEAKARRRVGTGSLSDVLNFEVQVNSAKTKLLSAKREHEVFLYGLAALMGIPEAKIPSHVKLAPLATETPEELVPPEPQPLIVCALKHRPDILQSDYLLKQVRSEIGVARAEFFPTINLGASLDGVRANSGRFEGDDFGNTIGVFLSYNLFAGGFNRAKLREAKAREAEAERNLENVKIFMRAEVRQAGAELKLSQEQVVLQRSNATLVKQNRDLVEKEYRAGQASLVRLNEAQRDLTTAQSRLVLALVSLRQAWHNLETSTGQILIPFTD